MTEDEQREVVKSKALIMSDREIAEELTRLTGKYVSTGSVECIRRHLGIVKTPGRKKGPVGMNRLIELFPQIKGNR